jgi:hypothetical protein
MPERLRLRADHPFEMRRLGSLGHKKQIHRHLQCFLEARVEPRLIAAESQGGAERLEVSPSCSVAVPGDGCCR